MDLSALSVNFSAANLSATNFASVDFSGAVYRIVESQEKVATMNLVDTLDEQLVLESLLDQSKPVSSYGKPRHYLIYTPFRYPPLPHGSRFGSRFEPAIFYAGATLKSALCEAAFYSFYFMSRSKSPFNGVIMNHKTSFAVKVKDQYHIDLTTIKDEAMQARLTSKTDYQYTQSVGRAMRNSDALSFSYRSARCEQQVNVGIFDINAIVSDPFDTQHWQTKQSAEKIVFYCPMEPTQSLEFKRQDYLVGTEIPAPSV